MGRRTIPGVGNRGFSPDAGRAAAQTKVECPVCAALIRPCNMARHRVACDRMLLALRAIQNMPWPPASDETQQPTEEDRT